MCTATPSNDTQICLYTIGAAAPAATMTNAPEKNASNY